MARGGDETDLRNQTAKLAKCIVDYKMASKTVKGLESQAKPKAPKQPKKTAKPAKK